MSRILITGITGFIGSWLAEYLLNEHDVYGIARWRSKTENIDHIIDKLHIVNADIRDGYSIQSVLQEVKPEYIFHLAAQSFVKESWNSPLETLGTNVLGTANILEAIIQVTSNATLVIAGSSEEYGMVYPSEIPIKETNPLRPMSPYGVSKVAVDKLGCLYFMSYGMKIIVVRPFNTSGPRRGEVFATSNFAKQIAEIEAGKKEPVIYVGNLEAQRDWSDVRDMVRAYWLVATKCKPGEVYNICRGKAWKISKMLDILLSFSSVPITVEQDPNRLRPSDVPILLGSAEKFKTITDWKSEIPFSRTLCDLLNYWREKVR